MDLKLEASKRTVLGRRVRRLRVEGRVPGVVYGHNKDAEAVALDGGEFRKVYAKAGRTHLVDLVLDGGMRQPHQSPPALRAAASHRQGGNVRIPLHKNFRSGC